MLSVRVAADQHSWDEHLSTSMLAYRTSVHESTNYTPFKLMFGREVRLPVELMLGMPRSSPQSAPGYVQKLKQDLLTAYDDARVRMKSSQARQADQYNLRAKHGHYQVGDRVWLFSTRVKRGQSPKFHSPWTGPFVVVEKKSDVVYSIRQEGRRKLQIVHFNRLKPCNTPPEQCVQREATDHLTEEVSQQPKELRGGPDDTLEAPQMTRDGTWDTVDIEDEDENSAFGWDATDAFVPGTVLEEPTAAPAGVEPVPVQINKESTVVEPAQSSRAQPNTAETVSGSFESDADERARSRPRRAARPPAWLRDYEVGNIRRVPTYAEALSRHAGVPFSKEGAM